MPAQPLSKFGLCTVEEAAIRRNVAVRTVQRWIEDEKIDPVPVGEGRNMKNLLVIAEVDALEPGSRGAPEGNTNAAKKKPRGRKKAAK